MAGAQRARQQDFCAHRGCSPHCRSAPRIIWIGGAHTGRHPASRQPPPSTRASGARGGRPRGQRPWPATVGGALGRRRRSPTCRRSPPPMLTPPALPLPLCNRQGPAKRGGPPAVAVTLEVSYMHGFRSHWLGSSAQGALSGCHSMCRGRRSRSRDRRRATSRSRSRDRHSRGRSRSRERRERRSRSRERRERRSRSRDRPRYRSRSHERRYGGSDRSHRPGASPTRWQHGEGRSALRAGPQQPPRSI